MQQRFQKELEAHAASIRQHQDALSGRLDKISADQVALSKVLQKTEKDVRACQEAHASFRDTSERRIGEFSVDLQRVKVSQEAALAQQAAQEKITSEIRSLKEGIDSIKHSVDGHEKFPSRPCSPSGDVRSVGPLLRPLYVRPSATTSSPVWQGGVRVRSVSPMGHAAVVPGQTQQAVPAGFLPRPPASSEPTEHNPDVKAPSVLSISCHSIPGVPLISGEYHLVAGETANGMPLWKHSGSELWLYCGTNRPVGKKNCLSWEVVERFCGSC